MRKTLLWKNAKPPLLGSPCHCRCYGVAPTASLPLPLLQCHFRRRATPERQIQGLSFVDDISWWADGADSTAVAAKLSAAAAAAIGWAAENE